MNTIKINLWCWLKYIEWYTNCDYSNKVKLDKQFDLNVFPYPFEDNYADEILLDNVLEHLDNVMGVMEELHRILKDWGVARIYVPYAKSDWAFQDITHKNFFTENSFNYFSQEHDYSFYTTCRFKISESKLYTWDKTLKNKMRNLIPFRSLLKNFLFNMYDGIYFELIVVK